MPHRDHTTDRAKLRYVLYARKSTEDENRQVRSIDDQISDCRKLARNQGLHVIDVLRESKSAKKPNQRPVFAQMLKDIEAKKYDAILCWHPDRLCRNMLEGGQIINMLDEGVLRDIRFNSHQFSNDANGKMLLGMLFVFSKQYSDDLSDKVNRGVRGNFEEGRSVGTPKLGYTRSEATGHYEPNEYFDDIQEAWHMRAAGESLETVTEYLLRQGVHRVTKNPRNQRVLKPTKSTVHNMFHDPFYYGILVQATGTADLIALGQGFIPVTDKATYDAIQAMGYGIARRVTNAKRTPFYPLRHFVYCAVCGSDKPMVVGKNKNGSGQHVLTYRCQNKDCTRSPRSLRAKHVFDSIYAMLERLELTDDAYEAYSTELDGMTDERIIAIRQEIHSMRAGVGHFTQQINTQTISLSNVSPTSPAHKPVLARLEQLTLDRAELEDDIKKLEAKIANPSKIKLTKDEFLNVVKTATDKMRAGTAVEKDTLCRILFLNVRVDNEKVASYLWREPFATLVKTTNFSSGRGDWI